MIMSKTSDIITKEQLRCWYQDQKLSTWAIEKKYGVSRGYVYKKLCEYGIPTRSLASSHFKSPRKSFDGTDEDLAYFVGFAVGDLRVRLHNKGGKSETISIACSSTKPAQINLIKKLFSSYGHIWVSKKNNKGIVSIEAFVDLSFSFLFKNSKNIRKNLKSFNKESVFLSFLAGFSDAEGSIYISNNQARMSWGNYDLFLIEYIKQGLHNIGIETSKIICDNLQGYEGKDGYKRKKNYYHLTCNKKMFLKNLLEILDPYIFHSDKKKSLKIALKNISDRN